MGLWRNSLRIPASIGGWSVETIGVSPYMLKYGASGREYEKRVTTIVNTSLKIHKHLLSVSVVDGDIIPLYG
ncbi:MAG: hypothetical protein ACI9LL_000110 [Porticoccus sp.]|jgi:hypothetical protein